MAPNKPSSIGSSAAAFRRLVGVLSFLVSLWFFVVTLTPLVPWWAGLLSGRWNPVAGETLVVLAGSMVNADEALIGESSYWRAAYAVRFWRQGRFQQIAVSGGAGAAQAICSFLVAHGVPKDRILVEDKARSTRENALFLQPLWQNLPGRKVLLTSDYHMFRAWRTFRRLGLDTEPLPFPDIRKRSNHLLWRPYGFQLLLEESAKILYYRWRQWI